MTIVFRPGIAKILKILHGRRDVPIHLREISRETGLYGQSVSRYLRLLVQEKILTFEMTGNLKQYALAQNWRTYSLRAYLDIELLEQLPLLRRTAIKTYLAALPHPPIFAVVFGSTAKGTSRETSDIDILLITHAKMSTKSSEKEAFAQCSMAVSTFQMPYPDFFRELRLKTDKVVQSAITTGLPLTNHIAYYEAKYHERTPVAATPRRQEAS